MLTLTMMHDQYLGTESSTNHSITAAFHWSRGAALLNRKLSADIEPSHRDALWACAGLLGALAFLSLHAKTPEEVWPIRPSSRTDLDWLKMCEGKKEIWKIADPSRTDSIFYQTGPDFTRFSSPRSAPRPDLQELPPELLQLCKFDDASTRDQNPYLAPASFLAHIINLDGSTENIGIFLSFLGCLPQDYKQLLRQKDPAAMLVLAYWYAKMCQCQQWWIWRRACLEGQAICMYLRRYHSGDKNILDAIQYPESICITQALLIR